MDERSVTENGGRAARQESSARQRTVMELVRTADLVRRYFTELYAPHGLAPQQYNVLRILRGARPQPLATMEIAERMLEKTPGITRLLDRLEEKGLVERERHPEDRRVVLCSITDRGLELLEALEEPVREATEGVLRELDDAEVARLSELLARVRSGVA